MFALNDVESTDAAADVDADPFSERWIDLKARTLCREISGGDREEDEAAHLLQILLVDVIERIEVLYFTGDTATELVGVEKRDRSDAVAIFEQGLPRSIGPNANWGN